MDELHSAPINQAHFLSRKAGLLCELGNFAAAIELYKEANENLTTIFDKVAVEPILRKSIELQLIENDWKIHVLTLRLKADDEGTVSESPNTPVDKKDVDDDDVVVIDPIDHLSRSEFLTDSLYPNRTLVLQEIGSMRQRSSSASHSRNPLRPTLDNNKRITSLSGKKLPKTDANREEEIVQMVKVHQRLAREFF